MPGAKRAVHQDIPIIEIDSSPEPVPRPRSIRRSRSSSKTPCTSGPTSSKGKGKEKEKTGRRLAPVALGPVIELTDSESGPETVMEPGPSSQVHRVPTKLIKLTRVRSRSSSNALQAKPVGASTSLPNIPVAAAVPGSSSKKRRHATPLFLPSDEENAPPVIVEEQEERSPTKKAHQGKGKEKEKEREFVNLELEDEDEDWDSEFSKKPFPFLYIDNDPLKPVLAPAPASAKATLPAPKPPAAQPPQAVPAPAPAAPPVALPALREINPVGPAIRPAAPVFVQQAAVAQIPQINPIGLVDRPVVPAPVQLPPPVKPDISPVPAPEPEIDPASRAVAQVLEVIPDVEPEYLLNLVRTHLRNFGQQTAEHVLELLFEDGGYPKVDLRKKGKRKSDAAIEAGDEKVDEERANKKVKVDHASVERSIVGLQEYTELALVQLQTSFPFIPKPYLRQCLQRHRGLYAPTHLTLAAAERTYAEGPPTTRPPRPYVLKSTRYNPSKDRKRVKDLVNELFAEERRWLVEHLQDPRETNDMTAGAGVAVEQQGTDKGKEKAVEGATAEDDHLEEGTGIECQCCFAEYAFDKMVQCAEAHLFCRDCVSQYASTKLGEHNHLINCMHESGCKEPFPVSELRRILPPKLMDLYERVKQQKEIEAAGLEGLEECPFCEWKCVLEVSSEEEKLFRCGNEEGGCGVVSCRLCKKKEHLPKTCEEAEEDKHLDGRHAIEEAMTRALMRNCPKCKKAFVKEAGCNKMTCPNCSTLSCYVCRQIIKGYDHFNQTPAGRPSGSNAGGKCLLWDQVEERHAAEVKAAAEKAMEEFKRANPDVEDKDIKVDIPVAPAPPPPPQIPRPEPVGWGLPLPPINVHGAMGGVNVHFNYGGFPAPLQMPAHVIQYHPPPAVPARPAARPTRAQQGAAARRAQVQQQRLHLMQQQQQAQLQAQLRQQQLQQDEQYRQLIRRRQEQEAEIARENARRQEVMMAAEAQRVAREMRARARQMQQDMQQGMQMQAQQEGPRLYQEALRRHEVPPPPLVVPPAPAAGRKRRRR